MEVAVGFDKMRLSPALGEAGALDLEEIGEAHEKVDVFATGDEGRK